MAPSRSERVVQTGLVARSTSIVTREDAPGRALGGAFDKRAVVPDEVLVER